MPSIYNQFSWSPTIGLMNNLANHPKFYPIISTKYFVTATDSFRCKTIDSVFVKVNNPIKPVIALDSNLLVSTFANSYQWYFGGFPIAGEINQTTLANQKGNYLVGTIDANGCKAFSTAYYNSVNVGIEDYEKTSEVEIYPNPTSNTFNVILPDYVTNCTISICNLLGQIQYQQVYTNERVITVQQTLPKGIYYVNIKNNSNNEYTIKKLIVE